MDVDGVLDEYLFSGCWAGEYLPYAKAVEGAIAYAECKLRSDTLSRIHHEST